VTGRGRVTPCPFCAPDAARVFLENEAAYALWDAWPVTDGHALVIPRRHAPGYFDLTPDELLACDALLREARDLLLAGDPTIEGFNIGVNVGEVAGQTVVHCHFHLIPRRRGDVADPRGGVRHLMPHKHLA
jgi:diadenosine tetraphosphate (Ap4A) HIT family hydrolase